MPNLLREYLKDPFLNRLYKEIRKTGPMKSISLDLNQECNIRCTGCYYFSEGMDVSETPNDESEFDAFIDPFEDRNCNKVLDVAENGDNGNGIWDDDERFTDTNNNKLIK